MTTKYKSWTVGTGSVTINYGGSGNGTIQITSDPNNLYENRSMDIKVKTTDGSNIEKTVTIRQAARVKINLSNAVVTAANQTYNGSAKTPTPTVTLNGDTVPSTGYDVSYSNNTNAGTATITVTGKGDYTGTTTGTFTINQATGEVTTAPTAISVTYSGSAQYLVTAGSGTGTMYYRYRYKSYSSSSWSSWSSYSTSRPSQTNAGYYEVQYYAAASSDGNYTASSVGTISVTMSRASRSISFTSYPSTLGVLCSGTLAASPSAGSGDGTISFSSSNTSRATISGSTVTAVADGTVTITASISAGTNYSSASTNYTLTVTNYVDFGLPSGLKWATGNIAKSGSSYSIAAPATYGCYFAWADINGHNESDGYTWGTVNSDVYNYTSAHNKNSDISPTDANYDAAYANLGSPWHLPTAADWTELCNNTTQQKTTISGVSGWKFISKVDSGKFIFFPFAGNGYDSSIMDKTGRFGCWTASQSSEVRGCDCYATTSRVYASDTTDKYRGYSIRAVR